MRWARSFELCSKLFVYLLHNVGVVSVLTMNFLKYWAKVYEVCASCEAVGSYIGIYRVEGFQKLASKPKVQKKIKSKYFKLKTPKTLNPQTLCPQTLKP